jgi:hypothetical protein
MSTTRVLAYQSHSSQAQCSCGWAGPHRLLRARAVHDALVHCWDAGCFPAEDLVIYV